MSSETRTPAGGGAVDRTAVRDQLEETRADYHALCDSLTTEDWKRRSGNPAWTVGQLMWHLAWSYGQTPRLVAMARRGRGLSPPRALGDRLNVLVTRVGARRASPASVRAKYDAAHAKMLQTLAEVGDDDWHRGANMYTGFQTVESIFGMVSGHLREHAEDIRRGLGR